MIYALVKIMMCLRDNLNSDMERIQAWITTSRMSLNVQKSSDLCTWFSLKQASDVVCPPVLVNGSLLQNMETQKYLHCIFDNKLQWGAQLNNVCRKISYYIAYTGSH